MAHSLVCFILVVSTDAQAVEELLESLVPAPINAPVRGTVPLQSGATYRVVVTGTAVLPVTGIPVPRMFDDFYEFSGEPFFCCGPVKNGEIVNVNVVNSSTAQIQGVSLAAGGFPAFNSGHRYEGTFVASVNGVLQVLTRSQSVLDPLPLNPAGNTTITFRVELFGERPPAPCPNQNVMTQAERVAGCPVSTCEARPATIEAIPGVPTFGTPKNDVIVGTDGADRIFGRDGEDVICGLSGSDIIAGNADTDKVFGGSGDDIITGGDDDSRDFLFGDDGQDRLSGGKGDDVLDGGPDIDKMIGGPGNDKMFVSPGLSVITIIPKIPITLGQRGDDLRGGSGNDIANYSQLPDPVSVDLTRRRQKGGELLRDMEDVIGTSGNDVLIGNDKINTLNGKSGNDKLDVENDGNGNDRVIGGPDNDRCLTDDPNTEDLGDSAVGCERFF